MTGVDQVAESAPGQCPECGAAVALTDREAVCEACGLVVAGHDIDHGKEWRAFPDGPDRRRAAAVTTLRHDNGLGTEQPSGVTETAVAYKMASPNTDGTSRRIYVRQEAFRIGAALDWQTSHKERAVDTLGQLYDATDLIGRDADTVAAATCWLVARVFGLGLTPEDVLGPARGVERSAMVKTAHWIKRQLDLPVPLPDYQTRVRRVGAALGLDEAPIQRAVARVADVEQIDKSGRSPSALAAAALYIESDGLIQDEVADAAGVTPPTIRNQFAVLDYGGPYDD